MKWLISQKKAVMTTVTTLIPLHVCNPTVPSQGPEITNITRLTDGSIIVMWKLLTLEEARGFITGYTVTAQQADFGLVLRESSMRVAVSHNTTSAVITGLDPKLAYWVSVSAHTVNGMSGNGSRLMVATTSKRCHYERWMQLRIISS